MIFNKEGGGPGTGTVAFYADRTTINAGECITVTWSTANVQAVFYEGQGVPGNSSRLVCLAASYTFRLRVLFLDSSEQEYTIPVTVNGVMPAGTGMLTGRLIWQTTGVPAAGATVVACGALPSSFGCPFPVASSVTNINGDFYFSPIPAGGYYVTALLPLCGRWYTLVDGLGIPQFFPVSPFIQTDTGARAVNCPLF
ncbi:MAG: carboxypeptidase-like regulatory domain-containing protein [Anaerolineae bacterium]|nr:carboxypeptidase-like regulatory domain-containing protein [Anaerolineae bacterium]